MATSLSKIEARVIGCLMEKSVVTPDQYPLTLNALTNACNQKSSRAPVMNLSSGEVLHAVRALQNNHLIVCEENFKSQTEKYTHRLCNTPFSDYQFDSAQFAVICVLLLRGPRTPGEIRTNSGRLHSFPDNEAVLETLRTLEDYDGGALVVQLPRTPGRKDSEFMECLTAQSKAQVAAKSDLASDATAGATNQVGKEIVPGNTCEPTENAANSLTERVAQLEREVAELRRQLAALEPKH